jgi:hypothetical protein
VSLRTRRWILPGAFAVVVVAGAALTAMAYLRNPPARVLLAPMIGLDTCFSPSAKAGGDAQTEQEVRQSCSGPQGSAAALVESTLSGLRPGGSALANYELGYTLNVPLLQLFKERNGDWVIDRELLGRVVRTLRDTNRPAIVYLFSTHFGQNAPIEEALAADPANLSWTASGPLARDTYYAASIYKWSVANPRTAITARRIQAANAVITEICKLERRHIEKIRGITLLGEVHHQFPNFESGMGFAPPYLVSDYSPVSRADFQALLERIFGTIERLNAELGTRWTSFEQIEPPSKDIRTASLRDFTEHIDSFAHGSLPISGWAHVAGASNLSPTMVRIYRNGDLIGRVPANMGRQDVLAAVPELGTADTGWRFDMDFRKMPTGLHRIDILLENSKDDLIHLATRNIAILDKRQQTPAPQDQKALPLHRFADAKVKAHVDLPVDQSSYFYNPLVTYWHALRALQVARYLQSFNQSVKPQCLAQTKRFTHQIIPFSNPGWDQTKFAIDASLAKLDGIGLGVSLYGEATYGSTFAKWLAASQHKRYGLTEFHPLKSMDARELQDVLHRHRNQGAEFVSFFLEPRWKGRLVFREHNLFSLDPDNPKFGSAQLYQSVRQLLDANTGQRRGPEPLATANPTRNTP